MRDLYNGTQLKQVEPSLTQTDADTAFVGAIIDHAGYDSALYMINLGTMTDADVTAVVLLEEGDAANLSDAGDVADVDMLPDGAEAAAAFAFGDDDEVRKLCYIGSKRYTRITVTPTGNNSGALPIGIMCLLSHAAIQPTVQAAS